MLILHNVCCVCSNPKYMRECWKLIGKIYVVDDFPNLPMQPKYVNETQYTEETNKKVRAPLINKNNLQSRDRVYLKRNNNNKNSCPHVHKITASRKTMRKPLKINAL